MTPTQSERQIRPLRRVNEGCWDSRDGRWTFMRHWSDPRPQRWFAFHVDDPEYSVNEGQGHTTLRDVVAWAEEVDAKEAGAS